MNHSEAGFSMIDALLSMFIWSVCAFVFLPLYHDMRMQLLDAKEAVHVAEVMEHGARMFVKTGAWHGTHTIDDTEYTYHIHLPTICVTYTDGSEVTEACETF